MLMKDNLQIIFNSLYQKKVIFHERITLLCEVVNYDLLHESFNVELKVIQPLGNTRPYKNRMLEKITSKPTFTVGATYQYAGVDILQDKKIGRPYCPFTIWADAKLVETVSKLNNEELQKNLQELLWQ